MREQHCGSRRQLHRPLRPAAQSGARDFPLTVRKIVRLVGAPLGVEQ